MLWWRVMGSVPLPPTHPVIYTWMKGDELCNPLESHPPAIYTWNLNPLIYTWIKGDGLCDTSPPWNPTTCDLYLDEGRWALWHLPPWNPNHPWFIYTWMKDDGLCKFGWWKRMRCKQAIINHSFLHVQIKKIFNWYRFGADYLQTGLIFFCQLPLIEGRTISWYHLNQKIK